MRKVPQCLQSEDGLHLCGKPEEHRYEHHCRNCSATWKNPNAENKLAPVGLVPEKEEGR